MRRTQKLLVAESRSSDTHSDESGDRLTDRPLNFLLKEVIYINNWDEKNRKRTDGKKEKLCDGLDDREEYFDRRGDAMFLIIGCGTLSSCSIPPRCGCCGYPFI